MNDILVTSPPCDALVTFWEVVYMHFNQEVKNLGNLDATQVALILKLKARSCCISFNTQLFCVYIALDILYRLL